MHLGTLTHLVTVEQLVGRTNTFGEVAEEYEASFQTWCSLEPLFQTERDKAAAVGVQATHRMFTWYHPELTASCRLRCGERLFNIISLIDVGERHFEFVITVGEVIDGV